MKEKKIKNLTNKDIEPPKPKAKFPEGKKEKEHEKIARSTGSNIDSKTGRPYASKSGAPNAALGAAMITRNIKKGKLNSDTHERNKKTGYTGVEEHRKAMRKLKKEYRG